MDKLDKEYGQLKIRLSELIAEKGLNKIGRASCRERV